jgi:hypothetical protein
VTGRLRTALLLSLGLLLLHSPTFGQEDEPTAIDAEAEARWLTFRERDEPALVARRMAAQARVEAARRQRAGELSLREAFPSLAEAPLGSGVWLDARLAALDARSTGRELERLLDPPQLVDPDRLAAWRQAWEGAHAADVEADAAERRVLLLLRDALVTRPALRQGALDDLEITLDGMRADLERLWEEGEPDQRLALRDRVARVEAARATCRRLVAAEREAVTGAPVAPTVLDPIPQEGGELDVLPHLLAWHLDPDRPAEALLARLHERDLLTSDQAPPLPADVFRLAAARRAEASTASEEQARQAEQSAAEAQREAEEARLAARDARGRRVAGIKERVAAAQEAARAALEASEARRRALEDERLSLAERIDLLDVERRALSGLAALDPSRAERAVAAWRDSRDLVAELRAASLRSIGERSPTSAAETPPDLALAREFAEQLSDPEVREDLEGALSAWEDALGRIRTADTTLQDVEVRHEEGLLALLQRAKEVRRELRPQVPRTELAADRAEVWQDVRLELRLALPNLRSMTRRRAAAGRRLLDLGFGPAAVGRVVKGSFWVLVGLLAWWYARRRVPRLIDLTRRSGSLKPALQIVDLQRLHEPLVRVVTATVDLVALSVLLGPARAVLPELAVLLVLFRLVVTWQLLMGLFRLAVAAREDARPALFRLGSAARVRADRGARLLLTLVVAALWARYLALDFLGAEALGTVVASGLRIAVATLLVVQCHRVEPLLRPAVGAALRGGRFARWMTASGRPAWATRSLRGAIGITLLTGVRLWQITEAQATEGSLLAALVNRVNRRRLKGDDEQQTRPEPLPPELAARLTEAAVQADLEGEGVLMERADGAVAAWADRDDRRGVIVVLGDVGQGKGRWSRGWAARVEAQGRRVLRPTLRGRLRSGAGLVAWLEDAVGAPPGGLDTRLEELEPTVFLVEEIERTFLRQVGGFEALRALLDVASRHDSRHFWALSCHAPAWRYLVRIRRLLNPEAFQEVIELDRRTGAELRARFIAATDGAGFRLEFFGLVRPGTLAEDLRAERDRATEAWFRLLAEASGGNAGVAWRLAVECLSVAADGQTLRVALSDRLARADEASLGDVEQLVAAALYVHGPLGLPELALVNNVSSARLAPVVRALEDRGLIDMSPDDDCYAIGLLHLPAVTRSLRRRHFVHGGA